MNCLIVEDDVDKLEHIKNLICYSKELIGIDSLEYSSNLREALSVLYNKDVGILILDMSIPRKANDSNILAFGGRDIMISLERKKRKVKTIVVTQYTQFAFESEELTQKELDDELKRDFNETYCGMVFYESQSLDWQHQLIELCLNCKK